MEAVARLLSAARRFDADQRAVQSTKTLPNCLTLRCEIPSAEASRGVGDFVAHAGTSVRFATVF